MTEHREHCVTEICRECGEQTGGETAGNAVKWTLCGTCERRSGERRVLSQYEEPPTGGEQYRRRTHRRGGER